MLFLSRWFWVFLLIGVPVIWGAWRWHRNGALVAALIVLAVFWALVLALLEWAGRRDGNPNRARYGFIDVVIGADGRVSTSQTVVYAWTGVFASALVDNGKPGHLRSADIRPGVPDRQQLGRLPAAARRAFRLGHHREGDRLLPDAAGPELEVWHLGGRRHRQRDERDGRGRAFGGGHLQRGQQRAQPGRYPVLGLLAYRHLLLRRPVRRQPQPVRGRRGDRGQRRTGSPRFPRRCSASPASPR